MKLRRNKVLKADDLKALDALMASGLPVKTCFELISRKGNEEQVAALLKGLESGEYLEKVSSELVDKRIGAYLVSLMKAMPFKEALSLSLKFYFKSKELSERLSKALVYPLVLMGVSLMALFLFDRFGLDSIMTLLAQFKTQSFLIVYFRVAFRFLAVFSFLAFILLLILGLYFFNAKRIALFYVLISGFWKDSFVHIYFCEEFVEFFNICLSLGYHTKGALDILRGLHNRPLVSFLAFHLNNGMLQGKELVEAADLPYFDGVLLRYLKIGSYSRDFGAVLSNYSEFSRLRIEGFIKRAVLVLQLFAYGLISLVIVFIYQVLFLPMQAIALM